jgi:hypothetical protein
MVPAVERAAILMATKKQYETKKCPECAGKGTVKQLIYTPGKFDVGLCLSATFSLGWNDAGDCTAKYIEDELRQVFNKQAFIELLDDEIGGDPTKLKYKLELKVKKIK